MQAWDDKSSAEALVRTYVLPKNMRDAGITVSSIVSVAASVFPQSAVQDGSPSSIISGSAAANSSPLDAEGQVIGVNQAVSQSITAGLNDCTYLVRFTLILSTGETWTEDCMQHISSYVPAD